MADMKPLVLLPFALLAAGCVQPLPYDQQQPPRRVDGEPYYPYAPGGPAPDSEVGSYEPIPGPGTAPPPTPPTPPTAGPDPRPAPPPPAAPAPAPRPTYPTAKRTDNPHRVISPYSPYNVIDVEGFKSGALAKDPSNGKIFRVP
jgi:hypothetical protein